MVFEYFSDEDARRSQKIERSDWSRKSLGFGRSTSYGRLPLA
jgi:hypothetical protein